MGRMRDHRSTHSKITATGYSDPELPKRCGIKISWSRETISPILIKNQPIERAAEIDGGNRFPNRFRGYEALLSYILKIPMVFVSKPGRRMA